VTQNHISFLVMLVGTADTGICDLDEDLIVAEFLPRLGLDDLASLQPFENCEVNHSCVYCCVCVRTRFESIEIEIECECECECECEFWIVWKCEIVM
jgi:hypothetical protein